MCKLWSSLLPRQWKKVLDMREIFVRTKDGDVVSFFQFPWYDLDEALEIDRDGFLCADRETTLGSAKTLKNFLAKVEKRVNDRSADDDAVHIGLTEELIQGKMLAQALRRQRREDTNR